MSQEPNFGRNYFIALALCLLILTAYLFILNRVSPKPGISPVSTTAPPPPAAAPETGALEPAEGPFLEKPKPPALLQIETESFQVEFSTLGASITRLFYKGEQSQGRHAKALFYEGDPQDPGVFAVRLLHEDVDLAQSVFKLNQRSRDGSVEFVFERPGEYRLLKRYRFHEDPPTILLELELVNLSSRSRHFPVELIYGLSYDPSHPEASRAVQAVMQTDKIESMALGKISKKEVSVDRPLEWAGLMMKYFALLVLPDAKMASYDVSLEAPGRLRAAARLEPLSAQAGEALQRSFFIYAGPQRYETLKAAGHGFEGIMTKGFFGLFKMWILIGLRFFHNFTHNYGWAIVLVTLVIKGIFTPLTHISYENMKKMQALQPKLKSIQERYRKDPSKLNQEMMGLYRRNRVNPMMGCLPMLLQIPIFIAFYQVLNDAIEMKGAPFIGWIHDLSEPDRLLTLPFSIPMLGDGVNLLPLLMIGSMVWQQKLTPTAGGTPEQTKMMQWMPVIFGFLFYKMPSGLVLYWFINNVLSIIHQVFIKRMVVVLHHEDKESS